MNAYLVDYYSETLNLDREIVIENFGGNTSKLFIERETCYVLNRPQMDGDKMSHESKFWRLGRLSSSNISVPSSRSSFSDPDEYFAGKIIGLYHEKFTEYAKDCMMYGVLQEPDIRDRYSKDIGCEITEIGMAIWKQDTRFSGSLDGEIDQEQGIEIKAPRHKMYLGLMNFVVARKNNYIADAPRDYAEKEMKHIFSSHYDQMICNAIITNKTKMHYVVLHPDTKDLYSDIIHIDRDHWNTLYTNGCHFYDHQIQQLMDEHNIKRLDPVKMINF